MSATHWSNKLVAMGACSDAVEWARGYKSLRAAWEACQRPDWMFWLANRAGIKQTDIVLAASAIARLALVHVPAGEDRPRLAIEAAEAWAADPTPDRQAAAWAASAASYAAWAAASAASYASAAARAAWAASYAARAAASDAACDCIRARIKCPALRKVTP